MSGFDAAELSRMGYRRVSNKHRIVSRIDRPDWKEFLASHLGRSVAELYVYSLVNNIPVLGTQVAGMWCDYYRRVLSKDCLEGIPDDVFKAIPSSDHDVCGFIDKSD